MLSRRGFILGALAAPAVIRTPGLLMPVKPRLVLAAEYGCTVDAGGVTASELYEYAKNLYSGEPQMDSRIKFDYNRNEFSIT